MSSLAATDPVPSTVDVALSAEPRSMQNRLAGALAGRPDFRVHVAPPVRRLVAAGSEDDVLVAYYETLRSDDCEAIKQIKAECPALLIVVVCSSADGRAVRRALDSGIDGLVFADELEAALPPTVAAALGGQLAVPRDLRACLRKPALSAKERQVLSLLVMGFTNSEISAKLFLAESTVKSHLSSAYVKLGVRSRGEAVALLNDPRGPHSTGLGVVRG